MQTLQFLARRLAVLALATGAGLAQAGGTAIVIGGALKLDNDAVWQRIVDEAGGRGARIAVFATAAAQPERSAAQVVAALNQRGAQAEAVPVAPRLPGVDLPARVNDPALVARVAAAQGVYFAGGAQAYIVDTLLPEGRPTPLLQAVRAVFERGGVVAGSSAGAAIMSTVMFRDAPDNLQVLKGQWRHGQEYDRGLGFVGPALLVDQHFLKRGRIGRLLPAMRSLGYTQGLGVEENSAAVVKGASLEVIGAHGALLVDLRDAASDPALPAFNLRGARLSYLARGDRHDLASGRTTPAEHKLRAGRVEPWPGDDREPEAAVRYHLDILGEGTLVTAMTEVLDRPAGEARGLAYAMPAPPADPAPGLGFEFRLYKSLETVGWYGSAQGGEDDTVLNVRLDVRPVRVAQPLLTPLSASAEAARPLP